MLFTCRAHETILYFTKAFVYGNGADNSVASKNHSPQHGSATCLPAAVFAAMLRSLSMKC
jgi:hypothetical protein